MKASALLWGLLVAVLVVATVADNVKEENEDLDADINRVGGRRLNGWYYPTQNIAIARAKAGAIGRKTISDTFTNAKTTPYSSRSKSGSLAVTKGSYGGLNIATAGAGAKAIGRNTFTNTYTNAQTTPYSSSSKSSSLAATTGYGGGRRLKATT